MPNKGNAIIDFGITSTGRDMVSIDILDSNIISTSTVDAWIVANISDDHGIDDHIIEEFVVIAGNVKHGIGFTVYARTNNSGQRGKYNVGWAWA